MNYIIQKTAALLFFCCLLLSAGNTVAQEAGMADLREIVNRLKDMKTYSYETVTKGVFPGGQKDQMTTTVYMDGPRKRLCYRNEHVILLLTPQWAYKVDHENKNVSIFDVVRYNKKYKEALPELETVFKNNLAVLYLDSVLLRSGKLVSAKRKNNKGTFTVRFPAGYAVEEMVIVYNYDARLPESVTMKSFFPGNDGSNRSQGTQMETVSRNYTATIPESVFDTQQYFSIQRGKAILARFKNYKVSSIL